MRNKWIDGKSGRWNENSAKIKKRKAVKRRKYVI